MDAFWATHFELRIRLMVSTESLIVHGRQKSLDWFILGDVWKKPTTAKTTGNNNNKAVVGASLTTNTAKHKATSRARHIIPTPDPGQGGGGGEDPGKEPLSP